MSTIKVFCPTCVCSYDVPREFSGTKVRCKSCGTSFVVSAKKQTPAKVAEEVLDVTAVTDESDLTDVLALDDGESLEVIPLAESGKTRPVPPSHRSKARLPPGEGYAPVTPKTSQLKSDEQHLYTFKINLCVRSGWWDMKIPDWYPTMSFCMLHVTDKRALIEPYSGSKGESAVATGLLVGLVALAGEATPTGSALTADFGIPDGLNRVKNSKGEHVEIVYSEIANLGWEDGKPGDRLAMFNLKKSKIKVDFKSPNIKPLVFGAQAAKSGMFTTSNISKEFLDVMKQFLR